MKSKYKVFFGLQGLVLVFCLALTSFYLTGTTTDTKGADVASFYGTWKVTELTWYNEQYFVTDSVAKEMQQKINNPIDDFVITIEPESYIESLPGYNYSIDKPKYLFESYNVCTDSKEIYNPINGCRDYLESLNITNKPIYYLIVRDPIKDKMDSGEIDWYYVPTPVFIYVDGNTILHTSQDFVELFKCERMIKN